MEKGSIHTIDGSRVEVLVDAQQINRRVKELSQQIEIDYRGKELVVIGVLKGAFVFMSDLVRLIRVPLTCDFLRVSSYDGQKSSGVIRMEFDITQSVVGKHVLLVEDIVDTGVTLRCLIDHLKNKNIGSLRVASLLYKEKGTDSRKLIDYVAFEVPDRFVIGYGLDHDGRYRSLPYVGAYV